MKATKIQAGTYEVKHGADTYRIVKCDWSNEWQILLAQVKVSFLDCTEYVDYIWCNTFATKADCLYALEEAL
jgi:hypothetical protein